MSQTIELNIEIAEELPVGTQVADLVADAGLDGSGRDELQFDVISGSFYQYFAIGGDAASGASGHLLVVNRVLDREAICYHRSVMA